MKLKESIERAIALGSYFITVTTRDRNKEVGDLAHDTFQEDFSIDDVIPSLDVHVKHLGVKPIPLTNPVVVPEKVDIKQKQPLKIAIITHFNQAPEYYSPARAVRNQIKMLKQYGHSVVFFVVEGSKLDWGCEMRAVIPKFKRQKFVVDEAAKQKTIDVLRRELTDDFDLAITHDLYIDDCITYREAIKECGVNIPWLHWARSGVGAPLNFDMPNARYVYMNYADSEHFAKKIGVDHSRIRVVFNEKDPGIMFDWHPTTKMIVEKTRLWEKDIVQIYPVCTTRLDAKGINALLNSFAALKADGNKVCLIVCNSNGRKRLEEIKHKMEFAAALGLTEEDLIFTSTLASEEHPIYSETPHRVVIELMRLANLFVFPTTAEVCPNILLEAEMCRNLIVINEDLPLLRDLSNEANVLSYPFTSSKSMHYNKRDDESFSALAKAIKGQIKSNKADMQFRETWRKHRLSAIYENMLAPIIYEGQKK